MTSLTQLNITCPELRTAQPQLFSKILSCNNKWKIPFPRLHMTNINQTHINDTLMEKCYLLHFMIFMIIIEHLWSDRFFICLIVRLESMLSVGRSDSYYTLCLRRDALFDFLISLVVYHLKKLWDISFFYWQ